jgi:hypothetical protein
MQPHASKLAITAAAATLICGIPLDLVRPGTAGPDGTTQLPLAFATAHARPASAHATAGRQAPGKAGRPGNVSTPHDASAGGNTASSMRANDVKPGNGAAGNGPTNNLSTHNAGAGNPGANGLQPHNAQPGNVRAGNAWTNGANNAGLNNAHVNNANVNNANVNNANVNNVRAGNVGVNNVRAGNAGVNNVRANNANVNNVDVNNVGVNNVNNIHPTNVNAAYARSPYFAGPAAAAAAGGTGVAAGTAVTVLPASCTTVVYDGISYQQCGNTYYVASSSGYVAVKPPR